MWALNPEALKHSVRIEKWLVFRECPGRNRACWSQVFSITSATALARAGFPCWLLHSCVTCVSNELRGLNSISPSVKSG